MPSPSLIACPNCPPTHRSAPHTLDECIIRIRFCPSSFVIRRSVAGAVGPIDSAVNSVEDRDFLIRCAAVACVVAPLVFYRLHPSSATFNSARMIAAERAVLDKSFALPALRGKSFLRHRGYGRAHLSASNMLWRNSERPLTALGEFAQSFVSWPLPFRRRDTIYRLLFGVRLLLAAFRKCL